MLIWYVIVILKNIKTIANYISPFTLLPTYTSSMSEGPEMVSFSANWMYPLPFLALPLLCAYSCHVWYGQIRTG